MRKHRVLNLFSPVGAVIAASLCAGITDGLEWQRGCPELQRLVVELVLS